MEHYFREAREGPLNTEMCVLWFAANRNFSHVSFGIR